MNKVCVALIGFLFLAAFAFADAKKEQERVENSGKVIKEILDVPDNVPRIFSIKPNAWWYSTPLLSLQSASVGAMVAAS
jgi:hypothetical protein